MSGDGAIPESMKFNMEQGKGVGDDKGGFRILGLSEGERKQYDEAQDANVKRGRGRPAKDTQWVEVGKPAPK